MANGHINLTHEKAVVYDAEKPKEKDGIFISARPGGKKERPEKTGEGR